MPVDPRARRQIIDRLLDELLPSKATAGERQRALEAARTEMHELGDEASELELIKVARQAIVAVADDVRQRQAQEQATEAKQREQQKRETRKRDRVETGVRYILTYLFQLQAKRELENHALQDSAWIRALERKARRRLEAELTGAEGPKESDDDAKAIAKEVVDDDLEEEEEEGEEE